MDAEEVAEERGDRGARGGEPAGDRETHTERERCTERGRRIGNCFEHARSQYTARWLSVRRWRVPGTTCSQWVHTGCRRACARALAPGHKLRTKPTANDSSNFRKLLWDTRRGIQGTGAAARNAVSSAPPPLPSFARYHFPPPPLEQHRYPSFSVREITPLDIPSRSRPISIPPPRRFPTSGTTPPSRSFRFRSAAFGFGAPLPGLPPRSSRFSFSAAASSRVNLSGERLCVWARLVGAGGCKCLGLFN